MPVIDLVNECLEAMVANGSTTGVVYDTEPDTLAGHALRGLDEPADDEAQPFRHDPATLFGALPEHSSPAVPVAQPAAYAKLASDFSAPVLPYAQPLDVCRSYLGAIGTSRFAVMRCFRKDITEFVLDPAPTEEPAGFPRHLWRYPVRIDIAREYLRISPEEYDLLFTKMPSGSMLPALYGFLETDRIELDDHGAALVGVPPPYRAHLLRVPRALAPGCIKFHARALDERIQEQSFPDCEPCYTDKIILVFDDPSDEATAIARLAVFIRLWRKLQTVPNARYTFKQLCDICDVLGYFRGDGSLNPDFIRQLVAFQMLRDDFRLELVDPSDTTPGTGADRTHLLALWVDPTAQMGLGGRAAHHTHRAPRACEARTQAAQAGVPEAPRGQPRSALASRGFRPHGSGQHLASRADAHPPLRGGALEDLRVALRRRRDSVPLHG